MRNAQGSGGARLVSRRCSMRGPQACFAPVAAGSNIRWPAQPAVQDAHSLVHCTRGGQRTEARACADMCSPGHGDALTARMAQWEKRCVFVWCRMLQVFAPASEPHLLLLADSAVRAAETVEAGQAVAPEDSQELRVQRFVQVQQSILCSVTSGWCWLSLLMNTAHRACW